MSMDEPFGTLSVVSVKLRRKTRDIRTTISRAAMYRCFKELGSRAYLLYVPPCLP